MLIQYFDFDTLYTKQIALSGSAYAFKEFKMSFKSYKDEICVGDTVILYINIHSMYAIDVKPQIRNKKDELVDNVFQTTYGALKVISLVGKKFGSKVQLSRGWAYILHPTPELWTLTLPHRTQIIYSLDISVIVHQLELKPGSVAIESGTGSGSLSHALIRSIQPNGHLHTFDFHAARVCLADEEFKKHGLGEMVTVRQRDVCENGFGDELDGVADAVFLDLPHPWEAVPFVAKSYKNTGGRFCSFSPCIEQVQKTCLALRQEGFIELSTLECLQKEYQVSNRTFPVLNLDESSVWVVGTGSLSFTTWPGHDGSTALVAEVTLRDPSNTNDNNGTDGKEGLEPVKVLSGIPPATMPGHTGFLTFATLPPTWARVKP